MPRSLDERRVAAEIAKLRAEAARHRAEVRNLTLASEAIALEKSKIEDELSTSRSNRARLDAERQKIAAETANYQRWLQVERVKGWGAWAPALAGVAAFATVIYNIHVLDQQNARRATEDVARSLRELGDDKAPVRAAAAIGLGAYVADPAYGPSIINGLAAALALEPDLRVQDVLGEIAATGGRQAHAPLRRAQARLSKHVSRRFDEMPTPEAPDRQAREASVLAQIRPLQHALVVMAQSLAAADACAAAPAPCPVDLAAMPLRRFSFVGHGAELAGARFDRAFLSEADFTELDLTGTSFAGAWLNGALFLDAVLDGASFAGARLEPTDAPPAQREPATRFSGGSLRRADFTAARLDGAVFEAVDLAGARFERACLAGADLTLARGLDPAQLRGAYVDGARLPTTVHSAAASEGTHGPCPDP